MREVSGGAGGYDWVVERYVVLRNVISRVCG